MDKDAKLRPLYLAQILYERTDEDHYLTTAQLMEILEKEYGIKTHRQTIPDDVAALRSFGMDIQEVMSSQKRYNLISREFDIAEIKLLIDAVESSKFITKKKSEELVAKLSKMAGRNQAENLKRNIAAEDRIKYDNESIYLIIDGINEAINAGSTKLLLVGYIAGKQFDRFGEGLKRHFDISSRDLLMLAFQNGPEWADLLIESGYDINIDNSYWLHYACKEELIDFVSYLLEHGADPYLRGEYSQTVMEEASGFHGYSHEAKQAQICKMLMEYGVDPIEESRSSPSCICYMNDFPKEFRLYLCNWLAAHGKINSPDCKDKKGSVHLPLYHVFDRYGNDLVKLSLPYQFRTGVIQRSVVWEREPEWKEHALEGLTQAKISAFEFFLRTGANDVNRIGRLKRMTANDFFRACALGYEACSYEKTDIMPADQYYLHADGRDEGLSGRGYGLNAGPGINFDDPNAWDQWYFHREQHGGHPWEVCRGGNSTHLSLYVCHDQHDLDYLYRTNEITEDEYKKRSESAGYYYSIAGKYRSAEAVSFYVALSQAGLPVVLSDAKEIMARFEGSGYIGIVPHDVATRYCESMFPEKYGRVIDFIHVYQDELDIFGDVIEWLPEEDARIE